eukprot:1454322-Alexandrium_andersonii.AAC.1
MQNLDSLLAVTVDLETKRYRGALSALELAFGHAPCVRARALRSGTRLAFGHAPCVRARALHPA